MVWAVPFSLAPGYFEPAEASGLIAPFLVYYALHDALVKPMPGQPLAPGLAKSWSAAPDGLAYEFTLRGSARFHNGDPVTAEDVKVFLRALPRCGRQDVQGAGRERGRPGPPARPLRLAPALA